MSKAKTAKKALFASVMSLILCFAMLLGTTYAWFTDSVTSTGNKIQSGTLKLDLELLDKETGEWASIKEDGSSLFNYGHWEPGYTEAKVLKVENEGTLALKWIAKFVSENELTVLADAIDVYVLPSESEIAYPADRDLEGYTKVGTVAQFVNTIEETTHGELEAGEVAYLGIVLKMQESAGNTYQGLSLGGAFDICILATQNTFEADSFDDQYDENAPVLIAVNGVQYETVEDALAAVTAATEDVHILLSNVEYTAASGHALSIPSGVKATLEARDYVSLTGANGGNGIYVPAESTLTVTGSGLTVKGNAGVDSASVGGSGIGGEGTIIIDGMKNLKAEGYGRYGFGIGSTSATVEIKNSHIKLARGGHYDAPFADMKYAKDAPEGGPAIGGKTITLTDTTVDNALGGSKAAGIGALYWNGVDITINNCTINNAVGGTSAAGIGGSRLQQNVDTAPVTININNSAVTAKGGYFGAGIGSGYDTHCSSVQSLHTINISGNSVINAVGGKYAAGVGTGYHVAALSGVIENSVQVNAVSGEKFYKDTYTQAMDIGFGVVDPAREAKDNDSYILYHGEKIGIPKVSTVVTVAADDLSDVDFTKDDAVYKLSGDFGGEDIIIQSAEGKAIVIDGTNATNVGEVVVNANTTILDSYSSLTGTKSGSYTVKNFKAKEISVFAYNTNVVIEANEVEFLNVYGGNLALNIANNTVDANFAGHDITNPSSGGVHASNKYGVYLRICEYDLKFDNNTVTDAVSHAVGIFGMQGTFSNTTDSNTVSSFSGNKITVNSTTDTGRAAVKIWDDATFAPNTQPNAQTSAASALLTLIKESGNTITLEDGQIYMQFYNVNITNW